jgi:hypothetical protein
MMAPPIPYYPNETDTIPLQIIDASKAWRDAWIAILTYQHALVNEFANMYAPIVGAADSYNGPAGYDTPQSTVERTAKLREEYEDLKRDLLEEVNSVDEKMIKPLMEAKEYLQPMKKTIKKREDRKVCRPLEHSRPLTLAGLENRRPTNLLHSLILNDIRAEWTPPKRR